METPEYNTLNIVFIIERDIKCGEIKTTDELLTRTKPHEIPHPAYIKLYKAVKAQHSKKQSFISKLLRA